MDPLPACIAWGMFGIPQPSSHMHAVKCNEQITENDTINDEVWQMVKDRLKIMRSGLVWNAAGFKRVDRKVLAECTKKVNRVVPEIQATNITDTDELINAGTHYQERDCNVHPAISTVTKVSAIFGSRFPAKSSYHDDCHKSKKYGGQTIGTVHDLLEWRNKISHCDWSDTTPFVCFAEKGNLKIDTFATVLMGRPTMGESRSW